MGVIEPIELADAGPDVVAIVAKGRLLFRVGGSAPGANSSQSSRPESGCGWRGIQRSVGHRCPLHGDACLSARYGHCSREL